MPGRRWHLLHLTDTDIPLHGTHADTDTDADHPAFTTPPHQPPPACSHVGRTRDAALRLSLGVLCGRQLVSRHMRVGRADNGDTPLSAAGQQQRRERNRPRRVSEAAGDVGFSVAHAWRGSISRAARYNETYDAVVPRLAPEYTTPSCEPAVQGFSGRNIVTLLPPSGFILSENSPTSHSAGHCCAVGFIGPERVNARPRRPVSHLSDANSLADGADGTVGSLARSVT